MPDLPVTTQSGEPEAAFPVGTSEDGIWLRIMHLRDGWVINRFDDHLRMQEQVSGDSLTDALAALRGPHRV